MKRAAQPEEIAPFVFLAAPSCASYTIKTNLYGYFHMAKAAVPTSVEKLRRERAGEGTLNNFEHADRPLAWKI